MCQQVNSKIPPTGVSLSWCTKDRLLKYTRSEPGSQVPQNPAGERERDSGEGAAAPPPPPPPLNAGGGCHPTHTRGGGGRSSSSSSVDEHPSRLQGRLLRHHHATVFSCLANLPRHVVCVLRLNIWSLLMDNSRAKGPIQTIQLAVSMSPINLCD